VKVKVCSITKKAKKQDTILYSSLNKINGIELYMETNNTTKGLGQFYNECIDNSLDYDYLVLVHDDVDIINSDLLYQLKSGHAHFDILGVAGCVNPKIQEKNLWHWMGGGMESGNLKGFAGHPSVGNSFYVSSFGPTKHRVVLLDGVFLSINLKKLKKTSVRFDDIFMFHHYDLDFCLTCNQNKLKLGVWPILINHQSPGLREFDEAFETSNKKFINKWKNK